MADGIRVMIYAGDLDLICNYLGNRRVSRSLLRLAAHGQLAAVNEESGSACLSGWALRVASVKPSCSAFDMRALADVMPVQLAGLAGILIALLAGQAGC
eukprot:scaffold91283_cov20-Tisochrysis_lutea.AAC.1